jgi:hypothetical protein
LAWGGSLNSEGSEYVRKVREAEKIVDYLNKMKKELTEEKRKVIEKSVKIIEKYVMNLDSSDIELD